jgi:hypothetical protein
MMFYVSEFQTVYHSCSECPIAKYLHEIASSAKPVKILTVQLLTFQRMFCSTVRHFIISISINSAFALFIFHRYTTYRKVKILELFIFHSVQNRVRKLLSYV